MLSLFHDYEHAVKVTIALLDKLNVNFTRLSVDEELQKHPDYPSLFSISALLTKRKVDNVALEVEPGKLQELPTPFIAHTNTAGGSFLLITSVNGTVKYLDTRGKEKEKPVDAFLKEWTNKVLLAESTSASGEKDYANNRKKELTSTLRMPCIIAVCIGLIFMYAVYHGAMANWLWLSLLLMLKLGGCVVSGMLLWYEIDKYNPALRNVCSSSKMINCGAILESKHAKLFNRISWSEIGFFYFASSFLFLILTPSATLSIAILSWLNLIALPYTVFSVVYQWRIARQWCLLCLTVQGVLVTEALVLNFVYWHPGTSASLLYTGIFYLIVSLSLVILFWMFVKPVLKKAQTASELKKESSRIKYKPQVFNALLREQKQITTSAEGLGITLGNPEATHTIIKVCNPYCGPCAAAHHQLNDLLDNNRNVKLQIIFTATTREHDIRALPVKHLMALYERNDEKLIQHALHDWYGSRRKDYKAFSAKYRMPEDNIENQNFRLAAMEKWCASIGILATPTFFINGFQLPKEYRAADLKHLFN
ncbi:vitamin K epoxide reductase family protein [Chryseosolibacter indicus]|uniref:Thioredoxin domain-containing protein n=1 Tax=Chryseosolibacter indicus TaxID=2782351 RepID=A0ABS5VVG5_9BACT|nr:vitamin K epoxide reductase family protein [Chryseosolibacter indicus]MBT1705423.1 thioredoxin domain-containing protein [Chryseosolibacter indicus]